jgi:hypothetical protein
MSMTDGFWRAIHFDYFGVIPIILVVFLTSLNWRRSHQDRINKFRINSVWITLAQTVACKVECQYSDLPSNMSREHVMHKSCQLTVSQFRHLVSLVSVPWNISCTQVVSGFDSGPLFGLFACFSAENSITNIARDAKYQWVFSSLN